MRRPVLFAALAFILPALGPAAAQDSQGDALGTLNPDEMTWQRVLENSEGGATDMVTCASGYMLTKSGNHAAARALFRRCAEAGYTGAMTWMSQLDNNGLGADYNPEAAADWDRQAAAARSTKAVSTLGLRPRRGDAGRRQLALRAVVLGRFGSLRPKHKAARFRPRVSTIPPNPRQIPAKQPRNGPFRREFRYFGPAKNRSCQASMGRTTKAPYPPAIPSL